MASNTQSTVPDCCLRGSLWEGTPTGTETTLPGVSNPAYVAAPPGGPSRVAVLIVHDMFGWTFRNARLLADAFAREAGATAYLPDFFGGEVVPLEPLLTGRLHELDMDGFQQRNARAVREPEIVAYARALRATGLYDRVGAVGYCYGGWAVLRLGAAEFADADGRPLVDCVSAGQPSLLTERDIDEVRVPVQVLAPEHDYLYTPKLKQFTFATLQKNAVPFDYQHFPGVEHGCLVRGNQSKEGEREAMARGKDAVVAWFKQWLHE